MIVSYDSCTNNKDSLLNYKYYKSLHTAYVTTSVNLGKTMRMVFVILYVILYVNKKHGEFVSVTIHINLLNISPYACIVAAFCIFSK